MHPCGGSAGRAIGGRRSVGPREFEEFLDSFRSGVLLEPGQQISDEGAPEVGTYLGGPRPRDELERAMPGAPSRRPGLFIVDLDGAMIGQITLTRATGHIRQAAGEAELGYLFLPEAWGCGYAAEACAAALGWFAGALPGEPVVLATQTANVRSMRLAAKLGFIEVERFEDYGAEQWFGVWSSATPSD
ncbi:GNAT family N-acetyltransferase [Streptomyces sp. NPDC005151]